ncbi:UNVERIFIED_CONTAM: hypothetical protein HDU68_006206 [Siphonaria sp. JEL0065]|nr:hypothetical protein HDU68_006206 [Siphonaria sp. JEL0065]
MTDTTTALTIVMPGEFHPSINQIRSVNDRAYPRWMPHMNIIFPFVPLEEFDQVAPRLEEGLSSFSSFHIELNTVGFFSQKQNATYNLQPSKDQLVQFRKLFKAVTAALPEVSIKHAEFTPHLTMGQCPKQQLDTTLEGMKEWLIDNPVSFTLDRVSLIKRSGKDTPFTVINEVYFGDCT